MSFQKSRRTLLTRARISHSDHTQLCSADETREEDQQSDEDAEEEEEEEEAAPRRRRTTPRPPRDYRHLRIKASPKLPLLDDPAVSTTVREIGGAASWSLSTAKPGNGVDQIRDGSNETVSKVRCRGWGFSAQNKN